MTRHTFVAWGYVVGLAVTIKFSFTSFYCFLFFATLRVIFKYRRQRPVNKVLFSGIITGSWSRYKHSERQEAIRRLVRTGINMLCLVSILPAQKTTTIVSIMLQSTNQKCNLLTESSVASWWATVSGSANRFPNVVKEYQKFWGLPVIRGV